LSGSSRGAGDLGRGLERLAAARALVPPMVDRPVVGDAKEPGAQGRHLLELRQLVVARASVSWTTSSPSAAEPVMRVQ
jgi:hypothetical protein